MFIAVVIHDLNNKDQWSSSVNDRSESINNINGLWSWHPRGVQRLVGMNGLMKVDISQNTSSLAGGSVVKKKSTCNAVDAGSIPGSGRFHEEELATHSGILAWKIPWTEEPERLQSTGSQSQTWLSNWAHMHTYNHVILETQHISHYTGFPKGQT